MKVNQRLSSLSEYHFQQLNEIKKNLIGAGKSITDLSIGDPDLPVDSSIIGGLIKGLGVSDYNKYPPYDGIEDLKKEIIKYYDNVYSVKLNIDEVLILIGSKEGINNIIPAVCGIGDYAVVPKLGYPVYKTCCNLWGVNTYEFELQEKNNYLPDLSSIPDGILDKSKLIMLNYPNNPTGATANEDFYKEAAELCYKNSIVLINDGAYNEIIRPKENPLSILQFDNKRQCIEFGTFSKIYNMTGFRVGYAVGNRSIIKALLKIKSNVDSGQFIPLQYSAIEALKLSRSYVDHIRNVYSERKIETEKVLVDHNIQFYKGEGTFYIWCKTPFGYTTEQFCEELLKTFGIIVTPGTAFGNSGVDYFRIALTRDKEEIVNALSKIKYFN
jgi:LL-diaminopimelate aminotransferase